MNKFWDQVKKDYSSRNKTYLFVSDKVLFILVIIGIALLFNKIHLDLTIFDWIVLIILISCIFFLIKREGYKEGYFDGAGDIGDRSSHIIEYDE